MLVSSKLADLAASVVLGSLKELEDQLYLQVINQLDLSPYIDGKIVVKGCSKESVPLNAYVALTKRLRPVARSIFFGEPCSTVPIFKKAK
jgi:diketogulonate reductase-like aldo/keto reductase